MLSQTIIHILSQHRTAERPHRPHTMSCHQLASLLKFSLPPHQRDNDSELRADLDVELNNLEAQGEILLGLGKRVCMAPPTLLIDDETLVTSLQFIGDRAYLSLAHQALQTNQNPTTILLCPRSRNRDRIQAKLKAVGIRCLTVNQVMDKLPCYQTPTAQQLSGHQWRDPIFGNIAQESTVKGYLPTNQWQSQSERWQTIKSQVHLNNLSTIQLLKLANGTFLWRGDGQIYEISPDVAHLAMFAIDQQVQFPLRLTWDEHLGRLDLRRTSLPRDYAQMVWRLSEPDPGHSRIRLVEAQNRARIAAALRKLGCELV